MYSEEANDPNGSPFKSNYPVKRAPNTRQLVHKLVLGNGQGRTSTTSYKYARHSVSATGLGDLGFARVESRDEDSGPLTARATRKR